MVLTPLCAFKIGLLIGVHCKRNWWNSGAKQDSSWLYAVKILALCWDKPYFPNFSSLMLGKSLLFTRVSTVTFTILPIKWHSVGHPSLHQLHFCHVSDSPVVTPVSNSVKALDGEQARLVCRVQSVPNSSVSPHLIENYWHLQCMCVMHLTWNVIST